MIRSEIREKAFMFLFQLELQKGDEQQQQLDFIEFQEINESSAVYFKQLTDGVIEHKEEIDKCYIPFLKGWTKERLPKVDLTIMRLAVFEMKFVEDVPDNVAISEAVLLAKKFSSEESRSYINAVLGKVSRNESQEIIIEKKEDTEEAIREHTVEGSGSGEQ